MRYREARTYCTALLLARKAIQKAIDKFKEQQAKEQARMLRGAQLSFDPIGDSIAEKLTEIPVVRVWYDGGAFMLERPETWISTFKTALSIFRDEYGQDKYNIIATRYVYDSSARRICFKHNISRMTYYTIQAKFENILVIVAAQNGLLTIEKPKEKKEGEQNV